MRHLSLPKDETGSSFEAQDVYNTCVGMVRDSTLRTKLESISTDIKNAADDYDIQATSKTLYLIPPMANVHGVSGDELVKVYTLRMVPKTARGRPVYDRILSAPANGRCPFCWIGTVNTLDHFLPKQQFPAFSVTPSNLIPACEWCQGEKMEYFATTTSEQLLHPYFDNFDQDIWLMADVVATSPAAFRYHASPPVNWTLDDKKRVTAHLRQLNLCKLFSSNAGSRLADIRGRLIKLHDLGGVNAVRAHLKEDLMSMEIDCRNSWVAAMYRAAIDSDWFCDGGFR